MAHKQSCTEERFLKDAATHQLEVLRDDGVNRHLRFKNPESNTYWFDIITWPGTLCVDGDMGTFVFRRLHDMFVFFRTDQEHYDRTQQVAALEAEKQKARAEFQARITEIDRQIQSLMAIEGAA